VVHTATSYGITADQIRKDLTVELPQWILSCYAPGKDAPEQLFGGYPREQSFEELQLHYRNGVQAGNEQGVRNEIEVLYQNAKGQIQTALGDPDGAVNFIIGAEHKHPNRHDVCKQGGTPTGLFGVGHAGGSNSANPLGASANNTSVTNGFGQPSTLGQRPTLFGAPAFSQPSQPQSAFGQPSQSQPAFGQPSQPQPAFGQPSQPASVFGSRPQPAFGQASQPQSSVFGQPSQPQSTFGQSSAPGARPSPFGQPAFGQSAQPQSAGSAFGQPSALGAKPSPFGSFATSNSGTSPFSQSATANANPSPFAQSANNPSPFAQSASNNNPNAFGQPAGQPANGNAPSPFGQATSNTASPFGQPSSNGPSPFAQAGNPASPFAQTAPMNANPSPFAQASASNQNGPTPSPFGATNAAPKPNPFAASQQPPNPSPFGQSSNSNNPFGAAEAPKPSPFGATSNASGVGFSQSAAPNAFAQSTAPRQNSVNGTAQPNGPYPPGSSKVHPPVSSYSSKGPNGLTRWKGKPVTYKDNHPGLQDAFGGGGSWVRIWFPDGPPDYSKDTELPDEAYAPEQVSQWQEFLQTGKFGGIMPELPPKREFCAWDF
jgi:nucleoporin NUP42